jgi:hypothetical protein
MRKFCKKKKAAYKVWNIWGLYLFIVHIIRLF